MSKIGKEVALIKAYATRINGEIIIQKLPEDYILRGVVIDTTKIQQKTYWMCKRTSRTIEVNHQLIPLFFLVQQVNPITFALEK